MPENGIQPQSKPMTEDEANVYRVVGVLFGIVGSGSGVNYIDLVADEAGGAADILAQLVVGFDFLPGRYRLTVEAVASVDTPPL